MGTYFCVHTYTESRGIGLQQKPENGVFDSRVKVVSVLPHVGVCECTGGFVNRYTCGVCIFVRGVAHRTRGVWIRCHEELGMALKVPHSVVTGAPCCAINTRKRTPLVLPT